MLAGVMETEKKCSRIVNTEDPGQHVHIPLACCVFQDKLQCRCQTYSAKTWVIVKSQHGNRTLLHVLQQMSIPDHVQSDQVKS